MIKKYINIFIIVICTFISLSNFSFAGENKVETEYEIQSSLKTTYFDEWIKHDEKYLEALSQKDNWTTSKIYKEIGLLNKELNDLRNNYYIKNKSNAKLYPAQITGCIHALTTGINNRYYLLDDLSSFEYEEGELNILTKMDSETKKGNLVQKELYDLFLNFALDVLNSDNVPSRLLDGSPIYLSPYELSASYNLVDNRMLGASSNYTSIVLSPLSLYFNEKIRLTDYEEKIFYLYCFYHEIGHSFLNAGVRNKLDVESLSIDENIDVDIINDYKKTTTKPFDEKYLSSINERFANDYAFYFISKHIDLNSSENIVLNYLLSSYRVEKYNQQKFGPFIEKHINNHNIKSDIPLIYVNTKTANNIDNLYYYDFSTKDNLLTIKVNDDYNFNDQEISIKITPVFSVFNKKLPSMPIGKLNKGNNKKTVLLPNGEYVMSFYYKDNNKKYKLNSFIVDIN